MKQRFFLPWLACWTLAASAGGLESLDAFVKTASSGRAEFVQIVSTPAREGQGLRSRTSSGSFEFSRPNRFKFVYRKPFEQSIVADGQMLWLYDVELKQVTARQQSRWLGATPAALLAWGGDLRSLENDFQLTEAADKDGLQWVAATPRSKDSQLQLVRLGFTSGQAVGTLAAMEMIDAFGQRSLLSFSKVEINPILPHDTFQFKLPAGVDLIRQ